MVPVLQEAGIGDTYRRLLRKVTLMITYNNLITPCKIKVYVLRDAKGLEASSKRTKDRHRIYSRNRTLYPNTFVLDLHRTVKNNRVISFPIIPSIPDRRPFHRFCVNGCSPVYTAYVSSLTLEISPTSPLSSFSLFIEQFRTASRSLSNRGPFTPSIVSNRGQHDSNFLPWSSNRSNAPIRNLNIYCTVTEWMSATLVID